MLSDSFFATGEPGGNGVGGLSVLQAQHDLPSPQHAVF